VKRIAYELGRLAKYDSEKRQWTVEDIDKEALQELCRQYDRVYQDYPESPYEGWAIYNFFDNLLAGKVRGIDYDVWRKMLK